MKLSSVRWVLGLGALVALALSLGGLSLSSGTVEAQVLPPHALSGSVTVDGQPATVGTPVQALVGGNVCGQATVNEQSRYVIQVKHTSAQAGCGTDGATINFEVGGNPAGTFTFKTGGSDDLNLTARAAPPAPPAPVTPVPTPRITTGTGGYLDENSSSTAWWALTAGILGLVLAGAAGVTAYRRVHR